MSRLTNSTYLANRTWLAQLWASRRRSDLRYLSYKQQMELHRYYGFAQTMTDAEASDHRAGISWREPSLPQRAGRALALLRQIHAAVSKNLALQAAKPSLTPAKHGRRTTEHNISVRVVARPQVDVRRLALAIVSRALAEERG